MNPLILAKIISILLVILAGFMGLPAGIALYRGEYASFAAFAGTMAGTVTLAGAVLVLLRKQRADALTTRDGFLMVTLSWVLVSVIGALPFFFSGCIPDYTDAFFETISGFSTTGASILTDVEALPRSMLFWRSLTHWLGGMGIVVLTVAILPLMGIGGLQLIQAESPGPTVDRLTPRITGTAKLLWFIYIGFTVAETLLLMLGGMDLFDALTHTFGTLGTGGFSPKNASVGHYNSAYIDGIITVFMLLAGINFSLHYRLLTGRLRPVYRDSELKAYLLIFAATTAVVAFSLYGDVFPTAGECLRYASFQTASFLTTTGFATANFEAWPLLGQIMLFILMFVGGCSGSTGGGIKVMRLVILFKQAVNELKLLVHPRGIFTLKMSGGMVRKNIVYGVSGFFFLYAAVLLAVTVVVASAGHDITTSFTAALTTLGNIGPGFGKVGPVENFSFFEDYIKWTLSFAMLVGRLELYTVLVIFLPRFWRK
ncbi:MAG TPA: potassium transporter TrkG [Spirochaetota bacterium]|nr:TrkH family potassium uptake protein [Spirochaetota bacterium]HOD14381.1 potassium transporter TrkG [Spirochaetota bacterium]HPN11741.1 potassium transporter TrkG [Spirochaetota bacterium]